MNIKFLEALIENPWVIFLHPKAHDNVISDSVLIKVVKKLSVVRSI